MLTFVLLNSGTHMKCVLQLLTCSVYCARLHFYILALTAGTIKLETPVCEWLGHFSDIQVQVLRRSQLMQMQMLQQLKKTRFFRIKIFQNFPASACSHFASLIHYFLYQHLCISRGFFSEKWRILFRIWSTLTCFKHHYKFWWCCDGVNVGVRNNQCTVQYEQSVQSVKLLATVPDNVTFSAIHVCN